MPHKHPTGQIEQVQRKPGRGFTGLSIAENLAWAKKLTDQMVYVKNPKCPRCGREFSAWELSKARSTGIIKCPKCGSKHDIRELTRDGSSVETGD